MRAITAVVATVATVLALVQAAPAVGETCPDPAGPADAFRTLTEADNADGVAFVDVVDAERLDPDADDAYALVLNGGGFGHGVGVSQFGMQGAGLAGCTVEEILTTYLPGTELTDVPDQEVRVGFFPDTPSAGTAEILGVRSVATEALTWRVDGATVFEQPPESDGVPDARYVCVAGGSFTIHTSGTCSPENLLPAEEGDAGPHGATGSRLTIEVSPARRAKLTANAVEFGRGRLDFHSRGDDMTLVAVLPSLDTYLYGLAEVPSLWSDPALEAQAIAGRSYAVLSARDRAQCDCDLYRTTFDQFYAGWAKEDPDSPATGGQTGVENWRGAVDRTSGTALGHDAGDGVRPVKVFYSSSHGGSSSAPDQVWGTDLEQFPYLQTVNTTAWEDHDASANRLHRWSKGFTADELAAIFGWDAWTGLEVERREPGGRPTLDPHGVRVTGVLDGEAVEATFSGEQIRGRLGLRSALFHVRGEEPLPPSIRSTRSAGDTRIDTAVLLSQVGWDGAPDVVIARADDPADALAGSALAGQLDAPVLLSPSDALPDVVAQELTRLGTTTVWLLGGPVALSEDVATAAAADGTREVVRLEGRNRFATAVSIATHVLGAEVDEARAEETEEGRTAYLVRGFDDTNPTRAWADALAVSAVAATRARAGAAWPVLTTDDTLPNVTRRALTDLGITHVVPVGGELVVTPEALAAVADEDVVVADRLAGDDRWATSRAVFGSALPTTDRVVVATGESFPDGLAAGPFAARRDAGLLLVPSTFTAETSPWTDGGHDDLLRGLGWDDPHLHVAGGRVAVARDVVERVELALLTGQS